MIYVADTHAWVSYLLDRLPKKLDAIFSGAERGEAAIFVPTIALAECLYLAERRKIALDFEEPLFYKAWRNLRPRIPTLILPGIAAILKLAAPDSSSPNTAAIGT